MCIPDDRDMIARAMEAALSKNELYNIDYRIIRAAGSVRYVNSVADKIKRDKAGNPVAMYGVIQDVTGCKQVEESLCDEKAKLNSIFRAAPVGIGVVVDRVIKESNVKLCDMLGYTREELIGMDARLLYSTAEEYERVGKEKYRDMADTGTGTIETRWLRKDGNIINILLSSTPIEPGNISAGVTFTTLDITQRKCAEKALIDVKMQAELYLDLMGNDINNINQVAIGYLELGGGMLTLDGEEKEFLCKPLEVLKRSSRLIEHVRNLQKVRSGSIQKEMICPGDALEAACRQFYGFSNAKISPNISGSCEMKVLANDLLVDVFSNIIENAIKHSRQQEPVNINIKAMASYEKSKRYCRISFEDDGPGIPDSKKQMVFDRLRRGIPRQKAAGLDYTWQERSSGILMGIYG